MSQQKRPLEWARSAWRARVLRLVLAALRGSGIHLGHLCVCVQCCQSICAQAKAHAPPALRLIMLLFNLLLSWQPRGPCAAARTATHIPGNHDPSAYMAAETRQCVRRWPQGVAQAAS